MSLQRSASRPRRSIGRSQSSRRKELCAGPRPGSRSRNVPRHDPDHMQCTRPGVRSCNVNTQMRLLMSLIYSKAFYLASAVVVASTIALAPALRAAPPVDGQAASAPPMDHSAMSKGDQPMTGNAGAMPGMMQHDGKMDMMQHHQQMMAKMHQMQGNVPTLPGQDAFGAIGEIVAMLEADPKTDWSKIDLEAL